MADYFTSDHFKLLNKWKGTIYDKSNPEQQKVYEELSQAFDVTKRWAEAVQQSFFPMGWSKTVRKPTDQWQKKFIPYNWGRIYPSSESPKELAYTVGIDAVLGFVVKIDVVDTQTEDSALRPKYEAIRGPLTSSPIVAVLPATDGLAKSFSDLVAWSVEAIRNFKLRYDDLVAQLNLGKTLSDEDLLKHFDGKPAFQTFRASWSPQDKALFCRLARAVHSAGLDWWHMGKSIQVRFGRKNPGSERAVGVLGVVRGTRARKLTWTRPVGPVAKLNRELLTDDLVAKIETALSTERESLDDWLVLETERPGLWPDQLRDDPLDPGEDTDDDEATDTEETRQPVNRIYYGPPGTGKTYELSKLLKREYEQAMTPLCQRS
ncbi:MAG TPA: restriction endonuclease, partial [Gammaproteobacteria bacterium]|nr:restriction endonuclease [Gammaproteobacteria bacterium]